MFRVAAATLLFRPQGERRSDGVKCFSRPSSFHRCLFTIDWDVMSCLFLFLAVVFWVFSMKGPHSWLDNGKARGVACSSLITLNLLLTAMSPFCVIYCKSHEVFEPLQTLWKASLFFYLSFSASDKETISAIQCNKIYLDAPTKLLYTIKVCMFAHAL